MLLLFFLKNKQKHIDSSASYIVPLWREIILMIHKHKLWFIDELRDVLSVRCTGDDFKHS